MREERICTVEETTDALEDSGGSVERTADGLAPAIIDRAKLIYPCEMGARGIEGKNNALEKSITSPEKSSVSLAL